MTPTQRRELEEALLILKTPAAYGGDPVERARLAVPGLRHLMLLNANIVDLYTAASIARASERRERSTEQQLASRLHELVDVLELVRRLL